MVNRNCPLFLGIDGGGSKCRAILVDEQGQLLGSGLGGAANPLRGIDTTIASIMDATHQALQNASLQPTQLKHVTAGIGLAGVNIPSMHQKVAAWQHPFRALHLTSDLDIACIAAHGQANGAVVIVGTGSCGLALSANGRTEIGGHGFLLGDKGSGAWFGNQAMRRVLEASDGLAESTLLTDAVLQQARCKTPLELVEKYSNALPKVIAQFAPVVFAMAAKNDAAAINLVLEGKSYIEKICQQLLDQQPGRLSLVGGLTPLISQWISPDIRQHIAPALQAPEWGAIHFARHQKQRVLETT
ncbi:MAG: N-acetylglucosamine kinase [Aestuariibacter sp.]